ncbi:hypothetical protein MTYP_00432 [Methylophilaceae bacterium]|nr:hypothetical protein MTYP_00432 [Methylophilaceae bacterium]
MDVQKRSVLLSNVAQELELPDSAYEKAIRRYEDLGDWFDRENSTLKSNAPHISSQGSFRLGTAIKPINQGESYDLDITCNLESGISKATYSQKELKGSVGAELELYRRARGIQAEKEEKHRCWRLEYADDVSFHMDIVPSIPEINHTRKYLEESMHSNGIELNLAIDISQLAVSITDNRHPNYSNLTSEWQISNPEGYARWFESRMTHGQTLSMMEKAQIDSVPTFKRKTVLQRTIQLLKRHRDNMFRDRPLSKPISIIITTIAALNYSGENDLYTAVSRALLALNQFSESGSDLVCNPVNPGENFADKWAKPEYADLHLKENFHAWTIQAARDFEYLASSDDAQRLSDAVQRSLLVEISASKVAAVLGFIENPYIHIPTKDISSVQTRPWYSEK